jgi:hypothetical protein
MECRNSVTGVMSGVAGLIGGPCFYLFRQFDGKNHLSSWKLPEARAYRFPVVSHLF